MKFIVGTRSSKLAIAQTNIFLNLPKVDGFPETARKFGNVDFEIKKFVTQGDKYSEEGKVRFDKINFVSDIEKALLEKKIDIAVHSAKDMPAKLDPRFKVEYFAENYRYKGNKYNYSPWDLYIFRDEIDISKIGKKTPDMAFGVPVNLSGLRVGTSSLRRKMQAKLFYKADNILDIRGNVDTRMQKLSDNQFDCIILSEQGLRRLGIFRDDLNCLVSYKLPAMGQGIVCLQYRENDEETDKLIQYFLTGAPLSYRLKSEMVEAQQFVSALGADCNSAIAIDVRDDLGIGDGCEETGFSASTGISLWAEIYGKDSFIRVASHDENDRILKKKYATMKDYPHAGEPEVITNILIEEAIEKGALDLLNEHN